MKTLLLSLAVIAAFVSEAAAQAPVGPGAVKLGKIEPAGVKSPEYQIVGGPQKRSKTGTWLEVEVAYETKAEEIDELTFAIQVMIENKLLDGSVTYINIPRGRDHFAVVYIAPRTLEKLAEGKPFTAASIQNVFVTVSRQGQILDQQPLKPGPLPNLPHVAGLVLNKNETPFAPLFYDRYEAIKVTR